jgi:ERF superfamily
MSNIKACAAFVKAQAAFGPALKTSINPAFKSRYSDLNSCIDAVMLALNANGLALMQVPQECETGVMVETLFIHESGEILSGGKFRAPVSKQDAQGYGSATTYARRYGLMAACGIAPEDDDGNAAAKAPHQPARPAAAPDPIAEIVAGVNRGDAAGAAVYLASLTPADLDVIWSKLPPAIAEKLTAAWPK